MTTRRPDRHPERDNRPPLRGRREGGRDFAPGRVRGGFLGWRLGGSSGWIALWLLATLGDPVVSQDRFLVASQYRYNEPVELLLFTQDGSTATILARFPRGLRPTHGVMDDRNLGYMLTVSDPFTTLRSSILHVDSAGRITSLVTGSPLRRPQGIFLDEQGWWFIPDEDRISGKLCFFRFDGMNSTTTVASTWRRPVHSVGFDHDTGQAVLFAVDEMKPRPAQCILRVDPRNGTVTSFTSAGLPDSLSLATPPVYEPASGALITATRESSNYPVLFKIPPEQAMTTLTFVKSVKGSPILMSDLGRQAPARAVFGLVVSPWPWGCCPHLVTLTRSGTPISTRKLGMTEDPDGYFVVRQGSRNLAPIRGLGAGQVGLHVSFPPYPGKPYVVGLSASGSLPAIPLPDGRVIPIVFDVFTLFSILDLVPSVMKNTVGVLDPAGRARMTLDFRSVPPVLKGHRLTACAVVLDAAASGGLAEISMPIGITVP